MSEADSKDAERSGSLYTKSLTVLRGIAQSFGVKDIFSKDAAHLIQDIEAAQVELVPEAPREVPFPAYDARLMTKPPSKRCDPKEADTLLAPYVALGLHVRYDDERWYMSCGKKTDQGTLRMPLRTLLNRAAELVR